MICLDCRIAGNFNDEGEIDKAAKRHGTCEFPQSCTCQHQTGQGHLNPEKVK